MPRSKDKPKETFVYKTLKLDLSKEQLKFWDKKFQVLSLMINKIIYHVNLMCEEYNNAVKEGLALYKDDNKEAAKNIFEQYKHLRPAYRKQELRNLRKTTLRRYAPNILAQVFNYEVARIVKYAETHLIFSKKSAKQKKFKKSLRYLHRRNELSIFTSGNTQTLQFDIDNLLFKYGKYFFRVQAYLDRDCKKRLEALNTYAQKKHITEIKIQRRKTVRGWNYYLIFTVAGNPTEKEITSCSKTQDDFLEAKGLVAVDINLNQIDIRNCTDDTEFTIEYYNKAIYDKYEAQIKNKQRKLDKLYRLHNPDCYDDKGCAIKGKKNTNITENMRKLHHEIQVLRDKFAEYRKQQYNRIANLIRLCGDELIIEKNSIDTWKTKGNTSKNMRQAVQRNAPGLFVSQCLKPKFDKIHELDTYKTKCSITCNNCGSINRLKGEKYYCTKCGLVTTRHINAVRNMEKIVRSTGCVS